MSRLPLHLLLSMAVLAGTLPCSCWAAVLPAPTKRPTVRVDVPTADTCPCCRAKKLASSQGPSSPHKPNNPAPVCPPGCFACLGAITPSPVMVPLLALPEPALDDTPATLVPLTAQTALDRSVPPPRAIR